MREISVGLKASTLNVYWSMMTKVAVPVIAPLSKTEYGIYKKNKDEVFENVSKKYPDGNIVVDGSGVVSGEK